MCKCPFLRYFLWGGKLHFGFKTNRRIMLFVSCVSCMMCVDIFLPFLVDPNWYFDIYMVQGGICLHIYNIWQKYEIWHMPCKIKNSSEFIDIHRVAIGNDVWGCFYIIRDHIWVIYSSYYHIYNRHMGIYYAWIWYES